MGPPFTGMFFQYENPLETAIPKKADKPRKPRPKFGGSTPPPLNEELIAQLQGAVRAAQRKRTLQDAQPRESGVNK
jgi:hypothetical protein